MNRFFLGSLWDLSDLDTNAWCQLFNVSMENIRDTEQSTADIIASVMNTLTPLEKFIHATFTPSFANIIHSLSRYTGVLLHIMQSIDPCAMSTSTISGIGRFGVDLYLNPIHAISSIMAFIRSLTHLLITLESTNCITVLRSWRMCLVAWIKDTQFRLKDDQFKAVVRASQHAAQADD